MPHLNIVYSPSLDEVCDLSDLCEQLRQTLVETGLFPLAGIRVRAFAADHSVLADGLAANQFADMVMRIATGRSEEKRRAAGQAVMDRAEAFFAAQLAAPHFALSLEIVEINAGFSWKANSMHARLNV